MTFDCADPRALSLFWNDVLGYELPPPPPGFDSWDAFRETLPPEHCATWPRPREDPDGVGPRLFFQQVPEGKTVKNRVHLDVRAAPGLQGERADGRARGGGRAAGRRSAPPGWQRHEPGPPMGAGHIVMQDPEGNEFCLD